jgi:two-component system sensor histidine kinase DesK
MREVERISREALREVRSAISGYRSEGLSAELARARLAMESAGVRLDLVVDPVALDPVQETVLALALREAVTNVARHAQAKTCRISLEATDEAVRLEVRDDGRGAQAPEGTGLSAMRERVEGIGGEMEREIDGGTVLTVTLPRRPPEERIQEAPSAGLAPEGAR